MQGQMYVPPMTKINKIIIIAYAGLFLLSQVLQATAVPLGQLLIFTGANSLNPLTLIQFLLHPFIDFSLMGVIFNALLMWFIGSELEVKWGSKFYLKFLAVTAYTGAAIFFLITLAGLSQGATLYGLNGVNLALLIAYGIIYSERTMIFMFLFPMKAKYFCMLLAGIEVFMAVSKGSLNNAWGHLIAMASGFIFLKYQSLKSRGLGVGNIMQNHRKAQASKKRGNLRLVKDEEKKPNTKDPKYWQ